uniref:Uncharacterized protein n=1 Tax=Anguilla anguilla TaxID=7936 RepID=A0A0E9UXM5_ANGAN
MIVLQYTENISYTIHGNNKNMKRYFF